MITVRFWAGARVAAGHAEEQFETATIGDLLTALQEREPLRRVMAIASLLVDGIAVDRAASERRLPDGAVVDVLPPFAGG